MNQERIPNKYFEMEIQGTRKRGRARIRWKDMTNEDIGKRNQGPSSSKTKRLLEIDYDGEVL
jgi:hypothetical protein